MCYYGSISKTSARGICLPDIREKTTFLLEVVDQKDCTAEFYHLNAENKFVRDFSTFLTPNEEVIELGANFAVVGKPLPIFLIAVY